MRNNLNICVLLLLAIIRNGHTNTSLADPNYQVYDNTGLLSSQQQQQQQQQLGNNQYMSQAESLSAAAVAKPAPATAALPGPTATNNGGASIISPGFISSTGHNTRLTSSSAIDPSTQYYPTAIHSHSKSFNQRISDVIAKNVLQFALDAGEKLVNLGIPNKSEFFSPVSVMSALSLLLLGAKGNSNSYQELIKFFRLNTDSELLNDPTKFHKEFSEMLEDLEQTPNAPLKRRRAQPDWRNTVVQYNIRSNSKDLRTPNDHIIKVASGLFVQTGYNLNPNYVDVVQSVYHSELKLLDFDQNAPTAIRRINNWVSEKTFGKIPNIINDAIAEGTNVIMASALYFKGFWENTFLEMATTDDSFYPNGVNQPPVTVKMMATGGVFPFYDSNEYDCRIIGLPYKGNLTTMYVIQPNESSRDKLKLLQHSLNPDKIEYMISKMERKSAILAFPKMHLSRTIQMQSLLNHMHLTDIFYSNYSDLSLISETKRHPSVGQQQQHHSQAHIENQYPLQPSLVQQQQPLQPQHIQQTFNKVEFPVNNYNDRLIVTGTNEPDEKILKYQQNSRRRWRRQTRDRDTNLLNRLESQRYDMNYMKSDLFVSGILHKVDVNINEYGTEAAAATLTYLKRSGGDVLFRADTPFLILIRHDPTKLILFYGIINEPEL